MLDRRPAPAPTEACACELCRALLALAESALRNRAATERRRATITIVQEEDHGEEGQ